jgi:hypothetical protein
MNTMMKLAKRVGATTVFFISSFLVFHSVLADGQSQNITLADPLGGNESFTTISTAVAGFLFWDVAAPLATIMVLVGAFQLITSSGDPEKVSQGRKTILYATVGLIVALIAGGAVNIIKSFISGS